MYMYATDMPSIDDLVDCQMKIHHPRRFIDKVQVTQTNHEL